MVSNFWSFILVGPLVHRPSLPCHGFVASNMEVPSTNLSCHTFVRQENLKIGGSYVFLIPYETWQKDAKISKELIKLWIQRPSLFSPQFFFFLTSSIGPFIWISSEMQASRNGFFLLLFYVIVLVGKSRKQTLKTIQYIAMKGRTFWLWLMKIVFKRFFSFASRFKMFLQLLFSSKMNYIYLMFP